MFFLGNLAYIDVIIIFLDVFSVSHHRCELINWIKLN